MEQVIMRILDEKDKEIDRLKEEIEKLKETPIASNDHLTVRRKAVINSLIRTEKHSLENYQKEKEDEYIDSYYFRRLFNSLKTRGIVITTEEAKELIDQAVATLEDIKREENKDS